MADHGLPPASVGYEVWELSSAGAWRNRSLNGAHTNRSAAQSIADEWNAEEAENAALEQRRIRREFVIVTTYTTRSIDR